MDGSETPESIIRPYLGAKERLAWTGRPTQGLRLADFDGVLIPFSLVWGAFAIYWNYSVWTLARAPIVFKLFGLPFLLIGLYLIVGRFLLDAWARSRTVYGLTSQRALIVRRLWGEQLLSAPLDHMVQLKRRGQSGDVEFGYRRPLASRDMRGWAKLNSALANEVTFLGIPDAMEVYRRAQALVDKADPI